MEHNRAGNIDCWTAEKAWSLRPRSTATDKQVQACARWGMGHKLLHRVKVYRLLLRMHLEGHSDDGHLPMRIVLF